MPKAKTAQMRTVLVPVRITQQMDQFLRGFVSRGMFSSRQEAIKYFISERMLRRGIREQEERA